jgi:hypothetical protein
MESTKQAVTSAFKSGQALRVYGYKNSDGEVQDIVVKFLPSGGYHGLIQESVKTASTLPPELRPATATAEDWTKALQEQITSWKATLSGQTPERNFGAPLTPVPDVGYGVSEQRPAAIYLTGLQRVGPAKTPDTSKCRNGVTASKKIIQFQTPVSSYVGTLILEPGKFERVEVLPNATP